MENYSISEWSLILKSKEPLTKEEEDLFTDLIEAVASLYSPKEYTFILNEVLVDKNKIEAIIESNDYLIEDVIEYIKSEFNNKKYSISINKNI